MALSCVQNPSTVLSACKSSCSVLLNACLQLICLQAAELGKHMLPECCESSCLRPDAFCDRLAILRNNSVSPQGLLFVHLVTFFEKSRKPSSGELCQFWTAEPQASEGNCEQQTSTVLRVQSAGQFSRLNRAIVLPRSCTTSSML